ncbi:XTP/dITP diphosphatase [Blautia liquoris]|uniref:dITP/XTP pyrophosphatase n=1 Tax=Blautia liquoris TaxID=2779518 RepID=A0A7M2RJ32_9FIRM|nr:XTP/dITP diphosphatase [Blautia liquoris]QOV20004.1 XTP/dITP diphosphatase [Blautia liquoris]
MKQIIFATGNSNKMVEIREILETLSIPVISMREAGIEMDVEENGSTFEENALIKARAAASAVHDSDTYVLADDSGLEIDVLNKEPGIYSARYMGKDTSYHIKNQNLLERMKGVPNKKRTARFICAIAAVLPDGSEITTRGVIEGKIGYEERGERGFGYDPIFYLPDMSRSTAQLSPDEKNAISHRGRALQEMRRKLQEIC